MSIVKLLRWIIRLRAPICVTKTFKQVVIKLEYEKVRNMKILNNNKKTFERVA